MRLSVAEGLWKCGSPAVLLPDLGKPLIFSATGLPVSGLMALGHVRGLLEGHTNL